MAKRTSKKSKQDAGANVAEIDALEAEFDFTPSESDGDMFGGAPAKKAQHFWPSAKRLIGLLRPERAKMILVVALVTVSVVLTVVAPKILGQAMDVIFNGVIGAQLKAGQSLQDTIAGLRAAGNDQFADMLQGTTVVPGQGIDFGELARLITIVLALYVVASALMWAQGYILNGLVMRVIYRLRQNIEEKLNRLPLSYFDTRQRGDVMSRVTNDVDNIQQALQQAFSQLVQSLLTVIGIAAMMFIVSWQLALIALIALPLSGIIAGVIGVRSQKLFAAQWKNTVALNGHFE
jgi:ATP-binding cassette subfamily B protein